MPRQNQADLALLLVAALWGTTFVVVKDALALGGPFTFLALRFGLATLALASLLAVSRRRRAVLLRERGVWRAGALLGLALCAGYVLQTFGLQWTSPARAAFITGLAVVIVPLLAAVTLRRWIELRIWLGAGLAVVGLALLTLGPSGGDGSGGAWQGDLLVLLCAFAFAVHIVLGERFAPQFDAIGLTLVQLGVTASISAAAALATEMPNVQQVVALLPAAVLTGVFATALALVLQFRAQRFTSAAHTALIFATEPVFGALAAYVLIDERLGVQALFGCGLIVIGMLLAQLLDRRGGRETARE